MKNTIIFQTRVLKAFLTEPELIPGVIYNYQEGGLSQAYWSLGAWWQLLGYEIARGRR